MTSQIESSIDELDCMTYIDPHRLRVRPIGQEEEYVAIQDSDGVWHREQATSRDEKHRQVHNQIEEQLRILRTSIDAVQRIHDREIATLYRLIEERTLVLSDVDEIYNDYC